MIWKKEKHQKHTANQKKKTKNNKRNEFINSSVVSSRE